MMQPVFLDGLWIAAQPVVTLSTGAVMGYEALIRGAPDSPWAYPATLFPWADAHGQTERLERICRDLALAWGRDHLVDGQTLFVNINGAYAAMPINPSEIECVPQRVALEISEQYDILDNTALLNQLQEWRTQGHLLVIDDYGTGYAAAATVLAIHPQIIKLDRRLVADIDRRTDQQSIVSTIRDYTLDLGIQIIAEGIETPEELQVLQQMGIDMGQGFLLGRPQNLPVSGPLAIQGFPRLAPLVSTLPYSLARWYAQMVYDTAFPAYLVTRSRKIVAWNAAAAEFTGWSQEIMEQSRCFDGHLAHESAAGQPLCLGACPLVWAMVHRSGSRDTVTLKTASGERRHATIVSMPIYDPVRQRVWGAVEYFWESSSGSLPWIQMAAEKV